MTETYQNLYSRNFPIISHNIQEKLGRLRVGIAGCGSTGGAYIDGLLRLGVQHFHLADNGAYEINNLNRQFVFRDSLDVNKAVAHSRRILDLNPEATAKVWDTGLREDNVEEFLANCDLVFDAVDVTTKSGMRMKLHLHEWLHKLQIPTSSALDLGYTQWVQSYNYHKGEALLKGRFAGAKSCENPLKALIVGFSPVEDLPLEISVELLRLLKNPTESACQLACVCYALAGVMTPYILYFLQKNELPPLLQFDLMKDFESPAEQKRRAEETQMVHNELRHVLEAMN